MAVQAQHLDELPMQQQHHHHARTVFSGPQSDLTCCNASGSRKRGRGLGLGLDHEEHSSVGVDMDSRNNLPSQFRYEQPAAARVVDSTGTSTSPRPAASPLSHDLYSRVHQHNIELDNIIRLQNERLRLELEQSWKRQCRTLMISLLENNKVVKRLKEKETELEMANRRNAELQEKLRQMSSENQMWFHVAKDNEAVVSSLKSSLQQVLLQNALGAAAPPPAADVEEGYGDSEEGCAVHGDGAARETARKCSVCGRNEAGVLLLPCRHLCVCKGCESKVDTCPVCNGSKNACLQIFMS